MQDLKLGCASSSVSPATPLAYDSRLCPKLGAKPPTPQSARALAAMYGLGKVNRAIDMIHVTLALATQYRGVVSGCSAFHSLSQDCPANGITPSKDLAYPLSTVTTNSLNPGDGLDMSATGLLLPSFRSVREAC